MIYELPHTESAPGGVLLVARHQLEQSIAELARAEQDADELVHSVRKRMKKLRGLLHLVRSALGRGFAREDSTFRDAGQRLAGARRGAAVLATFDALIARFPDELSPKAAAEIRARLEQERAREVAAVHAESHAAEVAETLTEALARVETWPLDAVDAASFERGIRRVYARARRRMRRALDQASTEDLHQWRKWAKYHFYHVRLLRPSWPSTLTPLADDLEQLTEKLGLEHDLDDLRQLLIAHTPPDALAPDLARLLGMIERWRCELRSEAFSLGARLFADRPKAAARRLRAVYEAWRSEPASDASGIED